MSSHSSSKKGFTTKNQPQKFIPKHQQQSNNSNLTLSNSLRQQQSSGGANNSISGKFVNYLPQDEAVAAGFRSEEGGLDPVESQKVVDFLNQECSRLLKLNPKDFWIQVASDTSLHAFLESFLKFRKRWSDFPYRGTKGTVAGVIVGEHDLSRRVFMIFYRMSSNRNPGAKASDSLSAKDHAVILQEKKLLDLPKLLDICAIYGYENEEMTRSIVTSAVKAQPSIHDSFSAAISHFLNIVHTMYERCTTSFEVLLISDQSKDDGSTRLHTDYLEVIDFINDAIVSMDALVSAYKHAAVYFCCPVLTSYGSDELLKTLARLHDSLLPTLQHGFKIIFSRRADDMLQNVIISLKMLSSRIANFCWKLLNLCYLTEELFEESIYLPSGSKIFPAQVEDPVIRADILVQTFRDISEECSTVQDESNMSSLLQSVEKNYQLISTLERLGNKGWIKMDSEQLQFLYRIMSVPFSLSTNISHLSSNKEVEIDEDSAILESKISQVKDLFPDYGKGFISACLEVYNYNPEEVIQRILEANLHSDLLSLDTSLDVAPPKTAPPPASVKDKGKGKLIEHSIPMPTSSSTSTSAPAPTPIPTKVLPASSTSSSSAGRFVRKLATNVAENQVLESIDETAKTFALKSLLEYEDEYDDSFDDLGLGVGDAGPDDLSERVSSSSASEASRWGSRQKPQFFVKDGKHYSYKVSGSVAVANYNEASIVNQAQKELIHGLGRGGNFPLGAVQKLMELNEVKQGEQDITENSNRRGRGRNSNKKDHNAAIKSDEGQYNEQHHVGGRGWGRGNTVKEQSVTASNEGRYDEQRQVGGRGKGREWGRGNQTVAESNEGRYDEQRQVGGRGRGRGRGNIGKEQNATESNEGEDSSEFVSERGRGGRARGGRRGGGRRDNYRKDQAMKKHFASLGTF
uniref:activating signal cointegrator 1 complex subunit 2 n=1 Tax=Erigeron canadensis TaxID=72917 RepID=UPI001CB9BA74|nr:activating signal cointegrator 1 complex subunit 2 [Erigeron canadensis]